MYRVFAVHFHAVVFLISRKNLVLGRIDDSDGNWRVNVDDLKRNGVGAAPLRVKATTCLQTSAIS
jgi:hypothetical protein